MMKDSTNGGCACTPNQSIKCTVNNCAHHCKDLSQRQLYATCVGVIFPVCLLSAAVYLFRGGVALTAALPYLAGGLLGGLLGGMLYGKVPTVWLRRIFAGFLFYAGVKYLL